MFFSAFAPFGMLDFSSDESEGEKIYDAMVAGYTDPRNGRQSIDLTPGADNYQEAKVYATAMAIAAARVTLRRAHAQLRPETSYELLEAHERRFGIVPGPNDTVTQRRAVLEARQKISRGPRHDVIDSGLRAILGSDFIKYRTISPTEASRWPTTPEKGPGVFTKVDVVARVVRLLEPVVPVMTPTIADSYTELDIDGYQPVGGDDGTRTLFEVGQSFTGNGHHLDSVTFYLKRSGAAAGSCVAKVYAHTGTFGVDGLPQGAALAVSNVVEASTIAVGAGPIQFTFEGDQNILLESGRKYVATFEFKTGSLGNTIDIGLSSVAGHGGTTVMLEVTPTPGWSADAAADTAFYVRTVPSCEVLYESWNPQDAAAHLRVGDELAIQPENSGLAEKVTVLATAGTTTAPTFCALFRKVHDLGASATTGPMPIWTSTKRFVLIVVKHAAGMSADVVRRIDEFLAVVSRCVTDWAIVEPTTPGATTIGPFTLDTSPLGLVTIGEIDI